MPAFLLEGVMLNSALYLTGCFVAGLWTDCPWAWKLALATLGVTYLCYFVQTLEVPRQSAFEPWRFLTEIFLLVLSVLFGVAAGVALLV